MKAIELKIQNLINLRTSLITVIVVLTGGVIGLILSDINIIKTIGFIILGIYFDILFICNLLTINDKINKNIGEVNE